MFWCWPTVCRQSADSLPTVCRQYDDVDVTMMFRMLADCRPTVGRQSAGSRPTVCRHHDDVFNKNINVNVTSLSVCVNSKTCSSLFVSGCVGRQSADSPVILWMNPHKNKTEFLFSGNVRNHVRNIFPEFDRYRPPASHRNPRWRPRWPT